VVKGALLTRTGRNRVSVFGPGLRSISSLIDQRPSGIWTPYQLSRTYRQARLDRRCAGLGEKAARDVALYDGNNVLGKGVREKRLWSIPGAEAFQPRAAYKEIGHQYFMTAVLRGTGPYTRQIAPN
jgi:hypothetical protein